MKVISSFFRGIYKYIGVNDRIIYLGAIFVDVKRMELN
jgi:hypothetical protein